MGVQAIGLACGRAKARRVINGVERAKTQRATAKANGAAAAYGAGRVQGQRARVELGAAGVAVGPAQAEHTAACLAQLASAADVAAQGHEGAHVHHRHTAQADAAAPAFTKAVGALQGAASEHQGVGQAAAVGPQGGAAGHRDGATAKGGAAFAALATKERARLHHGAAAVSVGAVQRQVAAALFAQTASATDGAVKSHAVVHLHGGRSSQGHSAAPAFPKTVGALQGAASEHQVVGQTATVCPQGGPWIDSDGAAAKGGAAFAALAAKERARLHGGAAAVDVGAFQRELARARLAQAASAADRAA